ncbi:MAG: nucleotidyltransferase family protein [Bdellovibrio sp.]
MDWKKLIVKEDTTVLEAMKVINDTGYQMALVVSAEDTLVGVLTDGDIRRGLLKGIGTDASVKLVMNSQPKFISVGAHENEVVRIMNNQSVQHFPVVDKAGKVVKIVTRSEASKEISKDNAVILMAGGLGTRLGELTVDCPKPMLKVGDKPILELIIENFKEFGFRNFFLSVNYRSDVIESYFGDGKNHEVNIQYIREKERLGTAGSLSLFQPINDLPVIVMNGDLLTKVNITSLLEHHAKNESEITMGVRQHDYQVPFGVVHVDGFEVTKIEEKPVQSYLVNAGIYCLSPAVFSKLPQSQYLDMPTFIGSLIESNKKVSVFPVHEYWLDIGRKDDFMRAEMEYLKRFK